MPMARLRHGRPPDGGDTATFEGADEANSGMGAADWRAAAARG